MISKWYRFAAVSAVAILIAAAPAFSSDSAPAVNDKVVKKSAFGSPETHALVFGSVSVPKKFGKDPKIAGMEFFQMNPAMEPMMVSPGRDGKVFFLQPLPIGSLMFMRSYQFIDGKTKYIINMRVEPEAFSIDVQKPGLLYLGDYYAGASKASLIFYRDNFTFSRAEEQSDEMELAALKAIRSSFRKTPWEDLIEKRIEELDK